MSKLRNLSLEDFTSLGGNQLMSVNASGSGSKKEPEKEPEKEPDEGSGSEYIWGAGDGSGGDGEGGTADNCMPEDVYWDMVNRGIKVSGVWVCGMGQILEPVDTEGSAPTTDRCSRCGAKYEWGMCPNCDKDSSGSHSSGSSENDDYWNSGSVYGSGSRIGGGGGGDSNNNGAGTSGNGIGKIAKSLPSDAKAIEELNKILKENLEYCGYEAMYNYLTKKGAKIDSIKIDPSIKEPGNYDPSTNTMAFRSTSEIYRAFSEEFIHFFQQNYYDKGITPYMGKGRSNIEFEAKLIQDIFNSIAPTQSGSMSYGIGTKYSKEYKDWLSAVTKNETYIPNFSDLLDQSPEWGNLNYWHFLEDFKESKPNYNYPTDSLLSPKVINYLHLSSGCNK